MIRLVERIGLQVEDRFVVDSYYYDGKGSFATRIDENRPLFDRDILHEISHYLVATDDERTLVEYGLPARPHPRVCDKYSERIVRTLDKPTSHTRECAAQILHREFGLRMGVGSVFFDGLGWEEVKKMISNVSPKWEETGMGWLKSRNIDPSQLAQSLVN
jgi:hypothetical protein